MIWPAIKNFINNNASLHTPYIVLDLDRVKQTYLRYAAAFHNCKIYYAIKANPQRSIIELLNRHGSYFDTASVPEIHKVLSCGVIPEKISYGNTIKKESDIIIAYKLGVRLFAIDSIEELHKVARAAPGSAVFCRILADCPGAQWPLTRKFGCDNSKAIAILLEAKSLGLRPRGISFHVGSQQTNIHAWGDVLRQVAEIFKTLSAQNIELDLLNLGGGFPTEYLETVPKPEEISMAINAALLEYFPNRQLEVIIEPGRALVGSCGVLCSEVVLIAKKSDKDTYPWLYLDAGKFNGLIETMDESIRYKILSDRDGDAKLNYILAGPTCDSVDVMYEQTPYALPATLKIGDKLYFLGTGAYTASYASIDFNGFMPIETYIVS